MIGVDDQYHDKTKKHLDKATVAKAEEAKHDIDYSEHRDEDLCRCASNPGQLGQPEEYQAKENQHGTVEPQEKCGCSFCFTRNLVNKFWVIPKC